MQMLTTKRLLTFSFLGKRWRFRRVPRLKVWGDVHDPTETNKEIRIFAGLRGQHELEILEHEFLHACFPQIDEGVITQAAKDISRALWRLGYRKEKIL
jgi:hypothetical protein